MNTYGLRLDVYLTGVFREDEIDYIKAETQKAAERAANEAALDVILKRSVPLSNGNESHV